MKSVTVNVYGMRFRDSNGNVVTADDVLGIDDPIDITVDVDDVEDEDDTEDSEIRAAIETEIDNILEDENGYGEFTLISFEYTKYDV